MSDSPSWELSCSSFSLRVCLDAPELSTPVLGEHPAPVVDRAKRFCVSAIQRATAVASYRDELHVEKHLQVLGHRRLSELERLGDLADRSLLGRDKFQDVPASRLGNGVERIRNCRRASHASIYIFPYGNMSRLLVLLRSNMAGSSFSLQ